MESEANTGGLLGDGEDIASDLMFISKVEIDPLKVLTKIRFGLRQSPRYTLGNQAEEKDSFSTSSPIAKKTY